MLHQLLKKDPFLWEKQIFKGFMKKEIKEEKKTKGKESMNFHGRDHAKKAKLQKAKKHREK